MIPAGVDVFVALEPIDMRYGFERLAGLVRERMGYEPRSGALFVFVGRRKVSAKVLFFDGSGMCLMVKRLDRGVLVLPEAPSAECTHVEIDEVAFEALLDGIDVPAPVKTRKSSRPRVH